MTRTAEALSRFAGGVALVIALAGFLAGRRSHGSLAPFVTGLVGSVMLVAGVVFLHGVIAKAFIGVGTLVLLTATIWNARLPRTCDVPVTLTRAH